MILKGYPRISETFISREILLLESLGIPIKIFSLRQPRETFSHDHVREIKAPVSYMPEYVFPHWKTLLKSNGMAWMRLGKHYTRCLGSAILRAFERRKPATLRHFLQAGHLAATQLLDSSVAHLHAHFCHTPTSVALFASELTGLPFSFTAHAKDIYTSEPEQLARKIQKAKFVVTCTQYNARYLKGLMNGTETPIHTIYHGIDLEFFEFSSRTRPAPPYRILSVGRLVAKKGYDDLLKALKILEEEGLDFQFVHIGSGDIEPNIRKTIRELGLSHRVQLLGTLPHDLVLAHYKKAHLFALACKVAENGDRDGIPNVLVEAMAVGLPVVTTRVSAIPELVENGVTGTLVESNNPKAMAEAIRRNLLHPEKCDALIPRARERVEELFDNRRCVMQLHSLFKEALGDA
ncbi:MAG: glycosyltransferase family 4 protein [Deltaproteobacteria bacterium]|jgi:glycosyltransferase involved in cell wall biosynthesis|nr:glycosyltransferase family 4 protein [Deltaproteobacteria bacterium]